MKITTLLFVAFIAQRAFAASGDVIYLKYDTGQVLNSQQITDIRSVHDALVSSPAANKTVDLYFWRSQSSSAIYYRPTEENTASEANFVLLLEDGAELISYSAPTVTYQLQYDRVDASSQTSAIKDIVLDVYQFIAAQAFHDVRVYRSGSDVLMDVHYEAKATPVEWVTALDAGAPLGQFMYIDMTSEE